MKPYSTAKCARNPWGLRRARCFRDAPRQELMDKTVVSMQAELKVIDRKIVEMSAAHVPKALKSMKGVRPVLQASLMTELPELGTLSAGQISKLVGVASLNCDSGTMQGQRHIWGGRARLRMVLYMATLVAIRWEPTIKAFYLRMLNDPCRREEGASSAVSCPSPRPKLPIES